jgi:hypothetical protein
MTQPPESARVARAIALVTTAIAVCGVWVFLLYYFKPSLLFLDTQTSGGDTPSFRHPIEHLRDVLLPAGNPQGWDLSNFAGYAPYQFYFLPPALLVVFLSLIVPFNVAFKLVTVTGTFLMPLSSMVSFRAMGFRFPLPAIAAAATTLFLFNEGNSMWGGNIPSTLAGEFSHSMGFALAVMFVGLLYQGVQTGRGWRSRAVILALAGLSHPVAFINAASPGVFFLLTRKNFGRNLRYLLLVYGTAVLLMGFWLLPLVAKIGFATSINWTWNFQSWREVVPKILYIPASLAALDALWILVRPSPANRAARYILTAIVVTAVAFYNATSVGLPEIRFVPFAQFLIVLLALDFVGRPLMLAGRLGASALALPGLALAAGILAYVESSVGYIPSWIKWNYEGLEKKPTYSTLRKLTDHMHGTIQDARVVYENSPSYDRFGSMRVFESLPALAHRATLEGLLLQTPVTSPFIYYIQSQMSVAGTGVIPGYAYPSVNPERGTARLDLFNARDFLAVSPVVKKAMDEDHRWEKTLDLPPYAIYHRKDLPSRYVRVPRFKPVPVVTKRWKKDFHRWFASDAALETPIVDAESVALEDRERFAHLSRSSVDLPHEPIEADCQIEEHLDHLKIEFTTTCPGLPHWVAVSYYPNWHVEGAKRIYLASPAFMLVFPEGNKVTFTFRRVTIDWIGILASLGGLGLVVAGIRRRAAIREMTDLDGSLATLQPWVVGGVGLLVLIATGWNVAKAIGPPYYYKIGWKAFEKQDYTTAIPYFERAVLLGGDSYTATEGTFFRAASLLRLNKPAEALPGYRDVIEHFPDSIWIAESHYHVGYCLRMLGRFREAKASFRYVTITYPGDRWAGFATDQLKQLREQVRGRRRG